MPDISVQRIERDLLALSKFGYNEADKGIYRQGFSDVDMEARRWVMNLMEELGMETRMDGAGNVIGRYGPKDKPAVMVGSHLDTVPAGGLFDGALGVMAGIECVRAIKENDIELDYPIEIVGTAEEEGRFGGMLGAQALAGCLTMDWLEGAKDANGVLLKEAMAAHGMNHLDALHAYRNRENLRAFIELHVEQGPVLEAKEKTIGVVDGISGVFKWMVRLIGKADHAGTAPMDMRSDAFLGLADFAHEIQRIIDEEGTDRSRITIGHVALKPGFPHTVPGEVDFTIVGRDLDGEVMKGLANACRRVLSSIARKHRLMFEYEQMSWLEPQYCSGKVTDLIEANTKKRGYSYMRMPSGAGHDVQFLARVTDAGLIFVPSVKGVSHAPDEWTHWVDVERGANVLLDCVIDLAKE
ncbi:Zn-dependent hydrolase [Kordiimonas lacus]|uniref:N-carbamoyl-L-amino-acid hydrolase n=1 Tax=Kordiimonas lacus TaxID=637679 RepID=A0A1G7AX86_9PROT|nr:Zn-dependent hydrolase [Kordiimonas lacus]SDE19322.1 N-carbamoyl-L-amino-acid hydrolase [Kordiimonas lacus]